MESRRGGGGFIRIRRLDLNRDKVVQIMEMLSELNSEVNKDEALDFVTV